ncbi:MAG: DNA internalization-related competence protein ComEC/Rec2 [Pseudomonadota bacterium]
MPWRVLSFAFGVWLLQQSAVLPAPTFLAGLGVVGVSLFFPRVRGLALIGAALLGCVWAGGFAHWRLADALPVEWEGRDIEMTGIVAELPQKFERGVRFVFVPETAAAPVPARIVLNWYRHVETKGDEEGDEDIAPAGALPLPHAGERWRFVVRLKRPHGNVNPHGFDYEGWLFERGIRATGYIRKSALTGRHDAPNLSVARLRETTRKHIERALPDKPYAGVLTALAIGDQQAIVPELWRLFAATGITHLMSISGLHVTMIGGLIAWLTLALWRRHPRLPLVWPSQKAAAVAGFTGAFAYALLAGFGVPAQRTLYMLGVVVATLLSGRNVATPTVLGAALLLVLLLDPWAVLSAGFWLSFGAVALLFYVANGRLGPLHWLIEWLRAQWAITLGMIPLLLALFQQFSLVSPLANAVAIPLVSLLVTPLALLGSVPGLAWALDLAHLLLVPLLDFLRWLANWPGALWQQHAPPPWAVPLALLGVAWMLLPRGFPARWAGLLLFLPLLLMVPERPAPGELKLTVLDVGQGQAVHVQTATHDLMFDTGPSFGTQSDAGSRILVPYLRASGVQRLDTLIVSHADKDHAGGADSLIAAVPVVTDERRCVDGLAWEWDGVRFHVLHPAAADYEGRRPSNALSCVLKIESAHGSVLIPGDVEGRAEAELLARHGTDLRANILVAPHHGGKKTASPEFVAAVDAREVIFPVGYRNRFGHPHPDVLERFGTARIHRTDRDGAVTLKVGAGGTALRHEREARRRYWQNRAFAEKE